MKVLFKKWSTLIMGLALGLSITYAVINLGNNTYGFESQTWSEVKTLSRQDNLNKILRLLKTNFTGDVLIRSYEDGPSATFITSAEIDGHLRQFILLADRETFIEGVIYSKYLTSKQITEKHSPKSVKIAEINQSYIEIKDNLKASFVNKEVTTSVSTNSLKTEVPIVIKQAPLQLPEVNSIRTEKSKDSIYENTRQLEFIEYGDKNAPLVYVYFDYNCGGCRVVKKHIAKFINTGELKVRYIPVATRNEDSYIKAAYSLIPDENEKRQVLFEYFAKKGTADVLIKNKAPRSEFSKGIRHVKKSNEAFWKLPNKLTPTFVFKHAGNVYTASTTSTKKINDLVKLVNK